jgi:cytochrome c5
MNSGFSKIVGLALVAFFSGCTNTNIQGSQYQSGPAFSNDVADTTVMGKWSRSCALCHINGEAGAPIIGDQEEWQRRLAQGEQAILKNVLDGYNAMPPLGYCMSCEVSDFRAMIAYMAGTNP